MHTSTVEHLSCFCVKHCAPIASISAISASTTLTDSSSFSPHIAAVTNSACTNKGKVQQLSRFRPFPAFKSYKHPRRCPPDNLAFDKFHFSNLPFSAISCLEQTYQDLHDLAQPFEHADFVFVLSSYTAFPEKWKELLLKSHFSCFLEFDFRESSGPLWREKLAAEALQFELDQVYLCDPPERIQLNATFSSTVLYSASDNSTAVCIPLFLAVYLFFKH